MTKHHCTVFLPLCVGYSGFSCKLHGLKMSKSSMNWFVKITNDLNHLIVFAFRLWHCYFKYLEWQFKELRGYYAVVTKKPIINIKAPFFNTIFIKSHWLSGRRLDSKSEGPGFETPWIQVQIQFRLFKCALITYSYNPTITSTGLLDELGLIQ